MSLRSSLRPSAFHTCLVLAVFSGWLMVGQVLALADPPQIPDSAYVQATEAGHLELEGKRVRFWGWIGYFANLPNRWGEQEEGISEEERAARVARARADIDAMADRIRDLGFNMVRLWEGTRVDFSRTGYRVGDGSAEDLFAYVMESLDKRGIRIWFSGFNNMGELVPGEPGMSEEWREAVSEYLQPASGKPDTRLRYLFARTWDRPSEDLMLARMRRMADFPNHYKGGLRLADDPQVAVWELINEEWWFSRMLSGRWQRLPTYFRDQLLRRWHAFLERKYGGDDALVKAWGFLIPGESLGNRSVQLAPLRGESSALALNDTNPEAIAALTGEKQTFGREDFTAARARDVIEFFMEVQLEHKRRVAGIVKSWGKSLRLSPLVWDTGTGFEIQSQYLHEQADAVTMCTYIKDFHHDPTHKRFPFNSGLEEPPRLCWEAPWVEVGKTKTKPFFVYEIQTDTRSKYRADFPYRVAGLASIQDWDIVCWHTYGNIKLPIDGAEKPFEKPLDVGHSMNLHFSYDEVQNSAMTAAAAIFRNFLLAPAPQPTEFIFGRKMLFDPGSMDYAGSYGKAGSWMLPTTYRYGSRIRVDPTLEDRPDDPVFETREQYESFLRDGYLVKGPTIKPRVYEPNPYRPTDQIAYDWGAGTLRLQAPGVGAFVGFLGRGEAAMLENGVRFEDISILNPPGMPHPVGADERYVALALAATSQQPLAESPRLLLSAVSTSFNTGYELATDKPFPEFHGPEVKTRGTLPVLVARVGVTVRAEALRGRKFRVLDWHLRPLREGTVKEDVFKLQPDEPAFLVEFSKP